MATSGASSGLDLKHPAMNGSAHSSTGTAGTATATITSSNTNASTNYYPGAISTSQQTAAHSLPTNNTKGDKAGSDVPDAGLRSLDHYKRALPPWRYSLRRSMLPLIRWETPYLAYMQDLIRTPMLDSYFAITANLGTHTFFMTSLPIMFWCGFPWFGKGLVHILATGVFFTGFIKDFLSLPRPLSPPLHRITMSGSAALEYGFPSTHSANSVSVAVYALLLLRSETNPLPAGWRFALEILAYFYAVSIVLGRLYCGMHGFLDVIVGSVMGAALGFAEYHLGPPLDEKLMASDWTVPLFIALAIILLVRLHPEPADDCPCIDDSIAFASVMIGLEVGTWRLGNSSFAYVLPHELSPEGDPFATARALGALKMALRVILGVVVIFAWRELMKPLLLRALPHVFRVLETSRLDMPRRFFTRANKYKDIPLRLRMDSVIPNVSDIPTLISSFRAPGRGRSVSVGPQSAADAYETLAYRERRRRESVGSNASLRSKGSLYDLKEGGEGENSERQRHQSPLEMYEQMMGQGAVVVADGGKPVVAEPATFVDDSHITDGENNAGDSVPEIYVSQGNELGECEVFSKLMQPRVRYDVEVVTKLVVYTGIAWLSVDIIPVLFEFVGLGVSHYR